MDLSLSTLVGAKSALKAAILAEVSAGFPVDLGFPDTIQPECIWISGNADGDYEYEVSSGEPSGGSLGLTVRALVTYGDNYEGTFARLSTLWDAVTAGAAVLGRTGSFHPAFGPWEIKEGRSTGGVRQMGFMRSIDIAVW